MCAGRTSSAGGSRAKTSRLLEAEPGSTDLAPGSSGNSPAPLGYFDHRSRSWRTSQLSLLGGSTLSSASFPASGTTRRGVLYELPTLERRTYETGCSSSRWKADYPTPTATDFGKSGNARGHPERRRDSLGTMAKKWSTPTKSMVDNGPGYARGNDKLTDQARAWPTTTTTTDAKDSARHTTTTGVMHSGTTLLDAARAHSGPQDPATPKRGADGLVLVPEFVEGLMGIPEGWTHVADEPACVALATPSSLRKRPRR